MSIIGQSLSHNMFGSGVITDLNDETLIVSFKDCKKKFIYPDAFKKFLRLSDNKVQKRIEEQIKREEDERRHKSRLEQAERERRQKIMNFKISANSHAAFNISLDQFDQIRQSLSVSTGKYLSGYSKGKPRIADRIKPNSLCLLTNCPNGKDEQERKIVGAFMVREDFFGEEVKNGTIESHEKYHISVPENKPLLFWEHIGMNSPSRWGNTSFKYCSASAVNRVLAQLVGVLSNTEQRDKAIEFYDYFCKMNRISPLIQFDEEEKKAI